MNTGAHYQKPLTLLIIDDDPVTIFLAKKTLQNFDPGLDIGHYTSGEEALDKLKKAENEQPGIILLDINMPHYNGWDFLDDYGNVQSASKIFMFTSSIDPNDYTRSQTYANVKGFISKPLDSSKIQSILEIAG